MLVGLSWLLEIRALKTLSSLQTQQPQYCVQYAEYIQLYFSIHYGVFYISFNISDFLLHVLLSLKLCLSEITIKHEVK